MAKIVIFKENTARIFHVEDAAPYLGYPDTLVDPQIPPGVPPHHWKLEEGKITVHSPEAITEREARLYSPPVPFDSSVKNFNLVTASGTALWKVLFVSASVSALVSLLLHKL